MAETIESLTKKQIKAIDKIRGILINKKSCNYGELTQLLLSVKYEIKINGSNHAQVYREDGTKVISKSHVPLTYPMQRGTLATDYVRKVLSGVIYDLESRFEI